MMMAKFKLEHDNGEWVVRKAAPWTFGHPCNTDETRAEALAGALEAAIDKWEFIHERMADINLTEGFWGGGSSTCGLCYLFTCHNCAGCPLAAAIGSRCSGSPYRDFYTAVRKDDRTAARETSGRMVELLKSLRVS